MPASGHVAWYRWILSVARAGGVRCSARQANALVVPVAAHFGVVDDGLTDCPPPWGDPTGETAVMNVLGRLAAAHAA